MTDEISNSLMTAAATANADAQVNGIIATLPAKEVSNAIGDENLLDVGTAETGIVKNIPKTELMPTTDTTGKASVTEGGNLLAGKYKTQEELVHGYEEAQRHIGQLKDRLGLFANGAPENYDFKELFDDRFTLDTNSSGYNNFIDYLKQNNIPEGLAKKLLEFHKDEVLKTKPDTKEEMKKLGATGAKDIAMLSSWIKNNFGETGQKWLFNHAQTAADISALKEIRASLVQTQVPTTNVTTTIKPLTKEQLLKDYADNLYNGDCIALNPDKQTEWMEKIKQFS